MQNTTFHTGACDFMVYQHLSYWAAYDRSLADDIQEKFMPWDLDSGLKLMDVLWLYC
jgi:hypothetical protein